MQWTDEGIVLGVKRHGETSAIAELLTREHGRHLGLVRGGFGSRLKPLLQSGNTVQATWRARLDEHLGHYTIEPLTVRTAVVFAAPYAVFGVTHLAALTRLLPERDPHPELFHRLQAILDSLTDLAQVAPAVARYELQLLGELGFGLDLDSCASTGATTELMYVSPKSGRAVSREAGEPWREALFRLPVFLRDESVIPAEHDVPDALAMTGFFITRHVLEPRGLALSDARVHFIAAVTRAATRVA